MLIAMPIIMKNQLIGETCNDALSKTPFLTIPAFSEKQNSGFVIFASLESDLIADFVSVAVERLVSHPLSQ